MTKGYGSSNKPIEIFGKDTPELHAFEDACHKVAPEAFKLMQDLIDAWQPMALEHSWYMPDAFAVKIKVMETVEKTLRIDELDDLAITVHLKENKGSKRGVALAANVVHSVDAYVLRTMQRRCSYDKQQVVNCLGLIQAELMIHERPTIVDPKLEELLALYSETLIVDVRMVDYITTASIGAVPQPLLRKLSDILQAMLIQGSFDLLTVHDA